MDVLAWLRLMRPANSLAAAGLVLVGGHLAMGWPWSPRVWEAAAAMWAVTTFGYVTNDLHDIPVDRINKPDRPLPSGRVGVGAARLTAVALGVIAVVLASRFDTLAIGAAVAVLGALLLYNWALKGAVLLGNALIALLSGLALGVGSYAAGQRNLPWLPALLVCLFILAREILKTIEDMEGDRRAGLRTLATAWGPRRAAQVYAWTIGGFVAASVAAYLLAGYRLAYLIVIAGVDVGLIQSARWVLRAPTAAHARAGLRFSKVGYFLGLLALLLA